MNKGLNKGNNNFYRLLLQSVFKYKSLSFLYF